MRTSEYKSLSEELDGEISPLQGTGEDDSMLGRGTTQERRTQVDGKPSSIADRKQPPRGCADRFDNQQIRRDAAQMEAKNLRGWESENCRI